MYSVAPLVGAWIEIPRKKLVKELTDVAPLVGAWIEITHSAHISGRSHVAPLVGAWIEILTYLLVSMHRRSPRGSVD